MIKYFLVVEKNITPAQLDSVVLFFIITLACCKIVYIHYLIKHTVAKEMS